MKRLPKQLEATVTVKVLLKTAPLEQEENPMAKAREVLADLFTAHDHFDYNDVAYEAESEAIAVMLHTKEKQ